MDEARGISAAPKGKKATEKLKPLERLNKKLDACPEGPEIVGSKLFFA